VVGYSFDDSAGSLTYTDDYSENGDVGITLSASQSGSSILVRYTSTNTGDSSGGTLTYSINHLG
jgi:hypothetical protein